AGRLAVRARQPGTRSPRHSAGRLVLRRAPDDRDRARLADRPLRGPAVLGAHASARLAPDDRAAAVPARAPVASDVAGAPARSADEARAHGGARRLDLADQGARPSGA